MARLGQYVTGESGQVQQSERKNVAEKKVSRLVSLFLSVNESQHLDPLRPVRPGCGVSSGRLKEKSESVYELVSEFRCPEYPSSLPSSPFNSASSASPHGQFDQAPISESVCKLVSEAISGPVLASWTRCKASVCKPVSKPQMPKFPSSFLWSQFSASLLGQIG